MINDNVLVLNYDGNTALPCYFAGDLDKLIVLSHEPIDDPIDFLHYEHILGLETNPIGYERAVELFERLGFGAIITDNEYEIERCGRLRDRLGIPGQGEDNARLFRDKLAMKEAAATAVPVPRAQAVTTEILHIAAAEIGLPCVLKPVDQGGSRDVHILRAPEDIVAATQRPWKYRMELEEYVDGVVYHVDAFISPKSEFVSAARYSRPPLDFLHGAPLSHLLLAPSEELTAQLREFLLSLLPALHAPVASAYHLEVIRRANGKFVLCEIAARPGGAQIPELIERTYGYDIISAHLRAGAGLSVLDTPRYSGRVHASVILPSQEGLLVTAPSQLPWEWVDEIVYRRPVGERHAVSKHSNDHAVRVILHASDSAQLADRSEMVTAYIEHHWAWDV